MPPRSLPVLDLVPPVVPVTGPRAPFTPDDLRLAEFRPEIRSLPSFFVWTLGCQMNKSDSEEMAGRLLIAGCPQAPTMDAADLVIINTCAIREAAEAKVIGRQGHLGRLKTANASLRVVMTGCSVRESNRGDLERRYPAVGRLRRPAEGPGLGGRRGGASAQAPVGSLAMTAATTVVKGAPVSDAAHLVRARADAVAGGAVSRGSAISAWLPIIYGCDKTCTYCIVPFSRGPERSRPFDEILDEARALACAGYREVTLLGQNVNSYGHDLAPEPRFGHVVTARTVGRQQDRAARPDLAELIRAIDGLRDADHDAAPAIPRLRFVTSHPWDLSDRLIEALRDCPSVCESVHLPVQSGSDSMLRRMGRQYTVAHYRERLDRIREAVPGITLSTDIIVGFCGETETEYGDTLRLLEAIRQAPQPRGWPMTCPSPRSAVGWSSCWRCRRGSGWSGTVPGSEGRPRSWWTRSWHRAPTTTRTTRRPAAAPSHATPSRACPRALSTCWAARVKASWSTSPGHRTCWGVQFS